MTHAHPMAAPLIAHAFERRLFTVDSLQSVFVDHDLPHTSRGHVHAIARGRQPPTNDEWWAVVEHIGFDGLAHAAASEAGLAVVSDADLADADLVELSAAATESSSRCTREALHAISMDGPGGPAMVRAEIEAIKAQAESARQQMAQVTRECDRRLARVDQSGRQTRG